MGNIHRRLHYIVVSVNNHLVVASIIKNILSGCFSRGGLEAGPRFQSILHQNKTFESNAKTKLRLSHTLVEPKKPDVDSKKIAARNDKKMTENT